MIAITDITHSFLILEALQGHKLSEPSSYLHQNSLVTHLAASPILLVAAAPMDAG